MLSQVERNLEQEDVQASGNKNVALIGLIMKKKKKTPKFNSCVDLAEITV